MRAPTGVLVAALVLAACADPVSTSRFDGPVTITPSTQWSGGTVTVTTSQLLNYDTAPIITADSDTLEATLVDDTTLNVVLPSVPTGLVDLVAEGWAGEPTLGTVAVLGFRRGVARRSPGLRALVPWPVDQPTGLLAVDERGEVVFLHAATGYVSHTGIDPGFSFEQAVGVTYQPGVFTTLADDSVVFWSWPYPPGGTPVKTGAMWSPALYYLIHVPAPWTLLATFHDRSVTFRSSDSGQSWQSVYNPNRSRVEDYPRAPVVNADRTLFTIWADGTTPYGTPVFDLPAATLRYRIPTFFFTTQRPFFADSGDLYIAGDSASIGIVARYRAEDGTELNRLELPGSRIDVMAPAPGGEGAYVFVIDRDPANEAYVGPRLLVLDRDLKPTARLMVPQDEWATARGFVFHSLIADPSRRRVYLLQSGYETLTFDILM